MTHLWDTHAAFWAAEEMLALLPPKLQRLAPIPEANAISAITLWELALLAHKGRIRPLTPINDWLPELEARLTVLPITARIALRAYNLPNFHGDPADRIIAATAIVHGLSLVTRDEKLTKYSRLKCVWD